jgi:hypothetical protein
MANEKELKQNNFWLYFWLGISGLLNISGMASIVDGLVVWAEFFRNFIDVYRWAVRDPLAYVGNAIWPFGILPGWVFDIVVLYSGLFLAINIVTYRRVGRTVFGALWTSFRQGDYGYAVIGLFAVTIFLPLVLLIFLFGFLIENPEERVQNRQGAMETFINFGIIVGLFILILLINWQIKNLGA